MIHHSKILLKIESKDFNAELTLPDYKAERLVRRIISNHKRVIRRDAIKNNPQCKRRFIKNFCFDESFYRSIKVEFIHL